MSPFRSMQQAGEPLPAGISSNPPSANGTMNHNDKPCSRNFLARRTKIYLSVQCRPQFVTRVIPLACAWRAGQQQPQRGIEQDAGAAGKREDDEADAEEDRVELEVLPQPATYAGDLAICN